MSNIAQLFSIVEKKGKPYLVVQIDSDTEIHTELAGTYISQHQMPLAGTENRFAEMTMFELLIIEGWKPPKKYRQ